VPKFRFCQSVEQADLEGPSPADREFVADDLTPAEPEPARSAHRGRPAKSEPMAEGLAARTEAEPGDDHGNPVRIARRRARNPAVRASGGLPRPCRPELPRRQARAPGHRLIVTVRPCQCPWSLRGANDCQRCPAPHRAHSDDSPDLGLGIRTGFGATGCGSSREGLCQRAVGREHGAMPEPLPIQHLISAARRGRRRLFCRRLQPAQQVDLPADQGG
jgi:hypothetical protein